MSPESAHVIPSPQSWTPRNEHEAKKQMMDSFKSDTMLTSLADLSGGNIKSEFFRSERME